MLTRSPAVVALTVSLACGGGGGGTGSSADMGGDDDGATAEAPTSADGPATSNQATSGATNATGQTDQGSDDTAGTEIPGLDIQLELTTPEQIAIHAPVVGTLPADATVSVRHRVAGSATWTDAHPLLRIHPEWSNGEAPIAPVDAFAGVIFDLVPGTDYDVELTLSATGQDDVPAVIAASTRALPAAAPAATKTAGPGDDLQAVFSTLVPGDVLELAAGTYTVDELYLDVSGTAEQPIYIRGTSRPDVIVSDSAGRVLQLRNASHVVLENLTLRGSGSDSGTDASSNAIGFWDGEMQEDVTIRDLDIIGVDMGIIASGPIRQVLVYGNSMRGNNQWTAEFLESNLTWNDDGIRVPGEGNAVFENTLHGFGDSFAVTAGVHSSAVYFHRNRITMTGDDAFEGDYATRNIGFYDNFITNSATFVSLDPLYSGPLYAFRNVAINSFRGPLKLNNTNTGFLFYNNTIVRTEGLTEWGWVQFDNGELRNWSYRNNLLIYRGSTGNLLAVESGGCDPIDFAYNAYYPDGAVWWTNTGASYGSMTEAIGGGGQPATTPVFGTDTVRHAHDVVTVSDPFAAAIDLGPDHLTMIEDAPVPELAAGTSPKAAGIAIPNVTDGFAGAAPDIGAVIEGRSLPQWGAIR